MILVCAYGKTHKSGVVTEKYISTLNDEQLCVLVVEKIEKMMDSINDKKKVIYQKYNTNEIQQSQQDKQRSFD